MATEHDDTDAEIESLHLESQPVLSIRTTIPIAGLGKAVDARLSALSGFLRQRGIHPAGPPFARYHSFGETETDFELGVPVAEPLAGEGKITAETLPDGTAIATWHIGPHEGLGEAYSRVQSWLKAHQREPSGAAWEAYHWLDFGQYGGEAGLPDPSTWRTQLVQPIK